MKVHRELSGAGKALRGIAVLVAIIIVLGVGVSYVVQYAGDEFGLVGLVTMLAALVAVIAGVCPLCRKLKFCPLRSVCC